MHSYFFLLWDVVLAAGQIHKPALPGAMDRDYDKSFLLNLPASPNYTLVKWTDREGWSLFLLE